jgi:hypothetical protein
VGDRGDVLEHGERANSILKLDSGFVCEVRHDQFLEDALVFGMVTVCHKVIAGIEDTDDPEVVTTRGETEVGAAPIALHTLQSRDQLP